MAIWLEKLGLFARSPDARPLSEIAADIDEELAFHVEESARALTAEGLDADSARAEALRRFGNFGRIRRECARTQMGERVMLQRIQLVLTATLVVVVGLMAWSVRESRSALAAERQASTELMARLEAQVTRVAAGPVVHRADTPALAPIPVPPSAIDRNAIGYTGGDVTGPYLDATGRATAFESAARSWEDAFAEQSTSWRHGLRVAERLSALPDAQGVEILARIWTSLSVDHREQVLKPFVFGGGHPHALEVLALGSADDALGVRQRAALYLETYAWRNLLYGDGVAEEWLSEWREQPVAEVLRANATRWAREVGEQFAQYERPESSQTSDRLFSVVDHIRLDTYAKEGVDLVAILREHGIDKISDSSLGNLPTQQKANVQLARSWCTPK